MYKVKENIKPTNLIEISNDQIEDHWKLYQGYVNQVNSLNSTSKHRYGFEYNGMVLHEYYFENLTPGGKKLPSGELQSSISKTWGNLESWKEDFIQTGKSRGIGWAILYSDKSGNLSNHFIINHDLGHISGFKPILVMDVWEHAYMVDHKAGGRSDYIEAFLKNVNWEVAESRFKNI